MKKHTILLILFLVTVLNVTAQKSNGIVSFKDKLLLKANLNTQSESFSIIDEDQRYTIEALNSFRLKLSANYKFLGFSLGFSPVSSNSEFKSEFFEAQLRFFIKQHWIQSFEYNRVRGFYVENVKSNTIEEQFPNLQTRTISGETAYIFNTNFSLNHLANQNEWQQYSAGSFIPSLKYGLNKISDQTDEGGITQNNVDIAVAASYYYTWCLLENWFVSPNISPELGVRFSNDKSPTTNTSATYVTRALNLGLQFGFTNTNISAGAKFSFNSNSINNRSARDLTNDKSFATLYFGYRIDPPKFIEKAVTGLEDKLGL